MNFQSKLMLACLALMLNLSCTQSQAADKKAPELALICKILIKSKQETEKQFKTDQAFIEAARSGDEKCANELIQAKADINARNYFGRTALMEAASNGNAKMTKLLLSHKASPYVMVGGNEFLPGISAALIAARNGHLEIAKLLDPHYLKTPYTESKKRKSNEI